MLHISQDVGCHERVQYWNSDRGRADFLRLVGTLVTPPPPPNDPEALHTLAAAVPRNLTAASAEDVDERVADAAQNVALRLRTTREMIARHHDFCHLPVPPRHSTYAGRSDRRGEGEGELSRPMPQNPHYKRWLGDA